ncbi:MULTISPECIES: organic hydroperoxide resistance protein [Pontibacillus]|uniref:Organic hydroperoxide resistance protein n=1 Tax=Pontibacillus chungwhensis TaxID=265426 RepID=A0ABY8UTR4_9BACI|nr:MULTISPECIES: organic hydroperoxide resistance protein [Pontibacillus]MCD5323344.1 organic hydroperoxide resistance protein [Pontibacillus sp. HN14]WIF96725.1 organic hydroperoxide resistance protein [Pontibacillus chungwhensis]
MEKALYTAQATAQGGRKGKVTSSDGTIDFELSMPKSLGGQEKEGTTNPEQLFAAGYSACFDSALQLVASKAKKSIESAITANVSIGKEGDGFGLAVELDVEIKGVSKEEAEDLTHQAHQVCPYSRATRDNIEVTLNTIAK